MKKFLITAASMAIAAVSALVVAGCLFWIAIAATRPGPPVFDAKEVNRLAELSQENGGAIWVPEPGGFLGQNKVSLEVPEHTKDFKALVLTLRPVDAGTSGKLWAYDYGIHVPSGNHGGVWIHVRCGTPDNPEHLEYEVYERVYSGGDALQFRSRAKDLIAHL